MFNNEHGLLFNIGTISFGICWLIAYLMIIYKGFRDKTSGMPLIALCLNFSWELTFSFVFPVRDPVQLYANYLWVAFDAIIFYQKFMYGRDEQEYNLKGLGENLFYPTLITSLVISFFIVYYSVIEWKDYIGVYSAFLMNALMSVAFIGMLARRQDLKGQSIYIAFFKMIGTLLPTLLFSPGRPLVAVLGGASFFYDFVYLVLVYKKAKELGQNVFSL